MQITNFDELVETLQKENVPFRADRDSQIVELAVHTGELHTEMVIRWEARLVLAQFIVAFPFQVPEDRFELVEHALTILNHRLIMPGFGMDGEKGLLYFRLVTPRQDDGSMSYDQIHRLISAAVDTMLDFYPLLVGVVTEGKNADELLASLAPGLAKAEEAAPATETAAAPAQAEVVPTEVAGATIEAAGVTTQVAGATTQEPEAAAKAAGVTPEAPGVHPEVPGGHPQEPA